MVRVGAGWVRRDRGMTGAKVGFGQMKQRGGMGSGVGQKACRSVGMHTLTRPAQLAALPAYCGLALLSTPGVPPSYTLQPPCLTFPPSDLTPSAYTLPPTHISPPPGPSASAYLTAGCVCILMAPLWCDLVFCSSTVVVIKAMAKTCLEEFW